MYKLDWNKKTLSVLWFMEKTTWRGGRVSMHCPGCLVPGMRFSAGFRSLRKPLWSVIHVCRAFVIVWSVLSPWPVVVCGYSVFPVAAAVEALPSEHRGIIDPRPWPWFLEPAQAVANPNNFQLSNNNNKQEPHRGYNRALKITVTHTVRLRATRNTKKKT